MKTQDSSMLYKLIVLYAVKCAPFALSNGDITEVIIDKGYMDALTIQSVINELIDSGLILSETKYNRTYLTLSKEGQDTITALEDRLNIEIKDDIHNYMLTKNTYYLNEHSIQTVIKKNKSSEYVACLVGKDKKGDLINLEMTFPTERLAKNACENFRKSSDKIYQYLINELLK